MAVLQGRRSTDVGRSFRSRAHRTLRRFVARPVTGAFIVVPLLGALLGMGEPAWLLTLSGGAALYLAFDLFLSWLRRPVPAELGANLNLVAWSAAIGVASAAAWSSEAFDYHGELVALVGMVAAVAVGLGSPRSVAVLWVVAAGAAVGVGASVNGQLAAETGMVVAALAVGAWLGGVIWVVAERLVPRSPVPVPSADRVASDAAAAVTPSSAPSGSHSRADIPGSPT
jgi:hypothetical protein